jgi:hypothetical protein
MAETLSRMNNVALSGFRAFINATISDRTMLWQNPWQLDPIDIVAAMGTDAVKIFTVAHAAETFIDALHPGLLTVGLPAGYTFTPNQDGSGVLTKA